MPDHKMNEEFTMNRNIRNLRTTDSEGSVTFPVEATITVWVTVPAEYAAQADEITDYDVTDEIEYLVSEAAFDLDGRTLDPIDVEVWNEEGTEVIDTVQVEASITGIGY